ncbi:hypothetical protein CFC21_019687 [Triticum aestivum]|uniref:Uncharacterized protein n=4 Tax=Triticum TaxID=4564 RepID=M8ABC6_TRIUA|nr:hypothetical protein TRIUR3_03116 [Triticum urartu]KAF7004478.1 hypothetical protein CFC21_019687 [Triticum aestivum]VAH38146.1 unnamed protein product [Triticum turgidum subsp. durum]
MASYAAQLLDVFYDLVERVTGYSARAQDDKDLQKHNKLATTEAFRTEEVVEIRSRNLPVVSGGSEGQVN